MGVIAGSRTGPRVSSRCTKPILDSGVQVELFITITTICHHSSYFTNVNRLRYRLGIVSGTGCSYFRTDMVLPDQMLDIRGVQASLYSCAVPQELDRTSNSF